MKKWTKFVNLRHSGLRVFILLFFCFCVDYVYGAVGGQGAEVVLDGEELCAMQGVQNAQEKDATDEDDDSKPRVMCSEKVLLDGEEYFQVQDEESLLYGLCYARTEGATDQQLLQSIKAARANVLCADVYHGREGEVGFNETVKTVHFSVMHEYRLSAFAARAFLQQYGLQDAFKFVCLEDLPDYSVFLDTKACANQVQIGLPTRKHPCQRLCNQYLNVEYGFSQGFERCRKLKDKQVVFFSSGRRGFRGAGEFLVQLCDKGGLWPCQNVNFFFTALPKEKYCDARQGIADAANRVARSEGRNFCVEYWRKKVNACVGYIGCQNAHKGRVVFAQDPGNVLVASWPRNVSEQLKDKNGPYDVLVGQPTLDYSLMMVPYLAQAYRLFLVLSRTVGAGCIIGDEDVLEMPDRLGHTLVCVKGLGFPFSEQFGKLMQERFGYKSVEFIACDLAHMGPSRHLVVGGSVVSEDLQNAPYFDVLFMPERLRGCRILQDYESGIVVDGSLYSKVWDIKSCQYGFCYALERGGTARNLLETLAQAKKDLTCDKWYRGLYEAKQLSTFKETIHISAWGEKTLSEQAARSVIKIYALEDSFFCVSFADLADFSEVGQFLQSGVVHVGDPKKSQSYKDQQFDACLRQYTPGKPILFCSSGRGGFGPASAFFSALIQNEDIKEQKPRLYFLVTSVSQNILGADGRVLVTSEGRSQFTNDADYRAYRELNACIECVAMAHVYDGDMAFAQDRHNLLVGFSPNVFFVNKNQNAYDVLVNWLPNHGRDPMSVMYRQSAYRLFEAMLCDSVGCVTGEESADFSKVDRTLLCVTSALFEGAECFGRSVKQRLHYKDVVFVPCDQDSIFRGETLVANGVLEKPTIRELKQWNYAR